MEDGQSARDSTNPWERRAPTRQSILEYLYKTVTWEKLVKHNKSMKLKLDLKV